MRALMESVLARYGVSAQVETDTGVADTKVFFRSINSDAWYSAERMVMPLGEVPRGRYVCLLSAKLTVRPDATLIVGGRRFLLRRIEPTAAFAQTVCQWCLCVEKGSGSEDDGVY